MRSPDPRATMTGSIRRLGAIGDIHAEHVLLQRALRFLETQRVDTVMAVGDIADGPGSVDECCALLRRAGALTVAGNHDRWLLTSQMRDLPDATFSKNLTQETVDFLAALPRTHELLTCGGPLLLCHGLGDDDMASVGPDDHGYALSVNLELERLRASGRHRFVVNGHTHRRMVRSFGDLTIVNAGTLESDHDPGFVVIDFEQGVVFEHVFEADDAISAARTLELAPA
jgi:predicted phosphodiesterase